MTNKEFYLKYFLQNASNFVKQITPKVMKVLKNFG